MIQPRKWWPGLLPLLALWVVLNRHETPRLEAAIAGAADAALAGVASVQAAPAVFGRDVFLPGNVFDAAGRAEALAAAQAAPGVRRVIDELESPPALAAYLWRASLDKDVLILSGAVDRPQTRAALVAAAEKSAPGARVIDQMTFFAGAPPEFAAQAEAALAALSHLAAAQVQLNGNDLSVTGRAVSDEEAQSALRSVQASGAHILKADISGPGAQAAPAAYIFSAQKSASGLILTGQVPDADAHARIRVRAVEKFSGLALDDRLATAPGAPKAYIDSVLAGLDQLARLESGAFTLRDHAAELTGEAARAETADEAKSAFLAGEPGDYAITTHLSGPAREPDPPAPAPPPPAPAPAPVALPAPAPSAPPPQDCRAPLVRQAGAVALDFRSGSAILAPQAAAALEALAASLRSCPAAVLEISAHTDELAHEASNLRLSHRRADAVAEQLARAGLPDERMRLEAHADGGAVAPLDGAVRRRVDLRVK